MSDTRNPDEIERDIERDREGLKNTIHEIQDTFSPDNLIRSVTDAFRTQGGDVSRSIGAAARDNPLALALTGVGLGWLIFGQGPNARTISDTASRVAPGGGARSVEDRYTSRVHDSRMEPRDPVPAGSGPNWIEDSDRGPTTGQRVRAGWHNATAATAERWESGRSASSDSAHRMGSAVSDRARRLGTGVSDGAHRVGDGVSDGAHRAGQGISDRAGRIRDRSSDIAHRLQEGTEHLSHDARERVVAARERAIEASERAGRSIQRGTDRAVDFFEEHPLVGGALAFAVGAAIAGALPRTRYEDEHFGEQSDDLYHEAERIFAEERAKAERVAGAALDEAKTVGDEWRADAEGAAREIKHRADDSARAVKDKADTETRGDGSAADAVADRVEDSARRVADAAEKKAQDEKLGYPKT